MGKRNTADPERKISVMGIINVTSDSYFSGSRYLEKDGKPDVPGALGQIGRMFEEGADMVDIGACSTRPGACLIDETEEWRRLSPLVSVIRKEFPDKTFSIDTFRASVVRKCFDAVGDFIINDISAGEDDPEMLSTAGDLGLTYIAMHKRGRPENMQGLCTYDDVTSDVLSYFRDFALKAEKAGIKDWILDPGFGFAKTMEQNYRLLENLDAFSGTGKKILIGISRKSMIYKPLGITPEEALAQTQVLHLAALERGADILRVHDTAEAVRTVRLYRMLYGAGPEDWR